MGILIAINTIPIIFLFFNLVGFRCAQNRKVHEQWMISIRPLCHPCPI